MVWYSLTSHSTQYRIETKTAKFFTAKWEQLHQYTNMELFDEDNPKWSHAQRYRNLGQPDKQEWIWFIILYVGAVLWHALMHCPHMGIKIRVD